MNRSKDHVFPGAGHRYMSRKLESHSSSAQTDKICYLDHTSLFTFFQRKLGISILGFYFTWEKRGKDSGLCKKHDSAHIFSEEKKKKGTTVNLPFLPPFPQSFFLSFLPSTHLLTHWSNHRQLLNSNWGRQETGWLGTLSLLRTFTWYMVGTRATEVTSKGNFLSWPDIPYCGMTVH